MKQRDQQRKGKAKYLVNKVEANPSILDLSLTNQYLAVRIQSNYFRAPIMQPNYL